MRMRWNPIVKKDLQVTARSMRLSWGVFAYETVLTMAFLLALAVIQQESRSIYTTGNIYGYLIYLFPVLSIAQVCIVALIVPVITASSISGEKERQTFDIMLTTCMSPFSIVLGKVWLWLLWQEDLAGVICFILYLPLFFCRCFQAALGFFVPPSAAGQLRQ